jgi:hypothetical protein
MIEWTVAEALWGYYEVVLGQEVPYPSVADFFWLSGYVFIFIALLLQYRVFRAAPTRRQWLTILFVIVLFSVIGGLLVIQPIIAQFDPEAVLEDVFNIAYPLFDLILLILTMAIIFLVEQGRFGFSWRLLGLGFIVMAAADLLFSYSTSIGIYFPDGQLNGITLTIDTLYYLGYLMQGLGGYTYLLLIGSLQAGKMNIVVRQPAKENILVFINQQGNIISVSDNFSSLTRSDPSNHYEQKSLSYVLGIQNMILESIISTTMQQGSVSGQSLKVSASNGESNMVSLSSLLVKNEQGEFVAIALVLQAELAGSLPATPLTEQQRMLINYYLDKSGTDHREENQALRSYFLEQISLLLSLVRQFSGTGASRELLTELNRLAADHQWHFDFSEKDISVSGEYEGDTLAGHISTLLGEARNFAGKLTSLGLVEREMSIVVDHLSTDNLRYLGRYALPGIARLAPEGQSLPPALSAKQME